MKRTLAIIFGIFAVLLIVYFAPPQTDEDAQRFNQFIETGKHA